MTTFDPVERIGFFLDEAREAIVNEDTLAAAEAIGAAQHWCDILATRGGAGVSTLHRYHPDPVQGDPGDALLFDRCERCNEHVETWQWSLDTETLADLLGRAPLTKVETRIRAEADRVIAAHLASGVPA